jgi:hypothetical protein
LRLSVELESLARHGRKRFESRAKSLRTALTTLQEVCDLDVGHEEELVALTADRDNWAKEAAPLLLDTTAVDFRRRDDEFRKKVSEFRNCAKLGEINTCLKAMREAVASLEKIVKRTQQLKESLPRAALVFDSLDRRTIAADPRSDEVYVQTERILEDLRERGQRGEVIRSIGLLDQVEKNLQILAKHSDHVRRDAAKEVALWKRVATICPRTASTFASNLASTPLEPSGDSLAQWMILRRSIENVAVRAATKTRSANAEALNQTALQYHWFDHNERHLRNFASDAYRQWQEVVVLPSLAGCQSAEES